MFIGKRIPFFNNKLTNGSCVDQVREGLYFSYRVFNASVNSSYALCRPLASGSTVISEWWTGHVVEGSGRDLI